MGIVSESRVPKKPRHTVDVPSAGGDVFPKTELPYPNGSDAEIGRSRVGRYELLKEIGRGGMGIVFRAFDPQLNREVAVKLIRERWRSQTGALGLLQREAQITAQLEHPNIVPVYDVGVDSGELYYVMKVVEGDSLAERLSQSELTTPLRQRLLQAFVSVCHATAYAHRRGVLHRDLKPANVMLGRHGEVLVMDWGLARLRQVVASHAPEAGVATSSSQTMAGGTWGYMPLEQACNGQVTEAADVFALGAILFELLTGEQYWSAAGAGGALVLPDSDPRRRVPGTRVSDDLAELCVGALREDPNERLSSAAHMATAVEAFLDGTQRQERAEREVRRANDLWATLQTVNKAIATARIAAKQRAEHVSPWMPLDDPHKRALWDCRHQLHDLMTRSANLFTEVVGASERALSQQDGFGPALRLLTQVYWDALARAEDEGNTRDVVLFESRIRMYGGQDDLKRLDGHGSVTLHTNPPQAVVVARRYEVGVPQWRLGDSRSLGATPLLQRELGSGSWVFELKAPGRVCVSYPVSVARGRHVDTGREPVELPDLDSIPAGFVYIPGGWTRVGGDPRALRSWPVGEVWVPPFLIGKFPTTLGEYLEFLRWQREEDPSGWARRAPRNSQTAGLSGTLWKLDGPRDPLLPPIVDLYGDEYDVSWPVFSVSWDDAMAYVAWLNGPGGVPRARLMAEVEYERAARGADGRCFPWGNEFDSAMCKMASSRPGRAQPEPVGAFASDTSLFGVRDLAGGIREWCGDTSFDDNADLRPVRGGAWTSAERLTRAANRYGYEAHSVRTNIGFRVAADVATPQER